STTQLARRLAVKQSGISMLERSERQETIKLKTLRKAAEAMECNLIYALVPKASFFAMESKRRNDLAKAEIANAVPGFSDLPFLTQSYALEKIGKKIPVNQLWNDETQSWRDEPAVQEMMQRLRQEVEKSNANWVGRRAQMPPMEGAFGNLLNT